MKALLRETQPSRQRGTNLEISGIQYSDSRTNGSSYSYQQSPSIAEQTIRQNTPGYSPRHSNNQHMVETKKILNQYCNIRSTKITFFELISC